MKLLVLVADYPRPDGYIQLMYVHVRNKFYIQKDIDVTVLNFKSTENYVIDNIPVITLREYNTHRKKYDVLVCHAANLRNHYRFLKKYENDFKRIVFFFHGHEVLRLNKVYPQPYEYKVESWIARRAAQDLYDSLKLKLWHTYYSKLAYKSHFVFVSRWIYNNFLYWTKTDPSVIADKYSIIHNSVGEIFEKKSYLPETEKKYDFITVRGNLDDSKYGVDIVNDLAKNNPDLKFLLIGRGEFFNHFTKADNITWINRSLSHEDMIELFNQSKCGLLPTRQDTQGVMTCEMAVFGLPVVTSNIAVCHEILDDFENVELINNEETAINLKPILEKLTAGIPYKKNNKYFTHSTNRVEVELYNEIWKD